MTSPRAATATADRTSVRRRNWAGEPTLLLGEDARGYDEVLAEGCSLARKLANEAKFRKRSQRVKIQQKTKLQDERRPHRG